MEKLKNLLKKLMHRKKISSLALISLGFFGAAYGIINYHIIISGVVYRWAANDQINAIQNFLIISLQAILLFLAINLASHKLSFAIIFLLSASALVNLIYFSILKENINLSSFQWMLEERRQFSSAFFQFLPIFLKNILKITLAIIFILISKSVFQVLTEKNAPIKITKKSPIKIGFFICFFIFSTQYFLIKYQKINSAEFNLYTFFVNSINKKYPERNSLEISTINPSKINKIIWLVDESINYQGFKDVMQPMTSKDFGFIDYNPSYSFSNCSSQSNAALRWGVDVENINEKSDLRKNATIWSYAKKSGYKTILIDGQVIGPPQNYIWPPEAKLIDKIIPIATGIDTDKKIAQIIKDISKDEEKVFIYVVLRGAHYQYDGNYPKNTLPSSASLYEKYKKAIEYSKHNFFKILFEKNDLGDMAVFYTSDHGQHIEEGKTPHCNTNPFEDEFSIPLLLYTPPNLQNSLTPVNKKNRFSHSQIFSTTLYFFGYDKKYIEKSYDNIFPNSSKRIIKFGKKINPTSSDPTIQVNSID